LSEGATSAPRPRVTSRAIWTFAALSVALLVAAGWAGYSRPAMARKLERFATDIIVLARVEAFASEIEFAGEESGLDPCLIAAMVYSESSGRPGAISSANALGLMQLLPDATKDSAARLGIPTPTSEQLLSDPGLNLRLGASHFAWTLKHEGDDPERALVAYNAGRARLARWIKQAGSYTAWREERVRAGNSPVLSYARRVLDYRQTFCERGVLVCEPCEP
jgi:soluble lytic murein transglycosylase-like protein